MKYAVTIDLSNDAFGPDEYAAAVAIAHALKSHANALLAFGTTQTRAILDANGNVVGEARMEQETTTTAADVPAVEETDAINDLRLLVNNSPDLDWLAIALSVMGHYPNGVAVVADGTFDTGDEHTLKTARAKGVAVSDIYADGTRLEEHQ